MFGTVLHRTSTAQSGTTEAIPDLVRNLLKFIAPIVLGDVEELPLGLARTAESTYTHSQKTDWLSLGGQTCRQQLTGGFPELIRSGRRFGKLTRECDNELTSLLRSNGHEPHPILRFRSRSA